MTKVTITLTVAQFDLLRRAVKKAAEREFELFEDAKGRGLKGEDHYLRYNGYESLLDMLED